MILQVQLKVKFRAFFIDFARYEQKWSLPLPAPPTGAGEKNLVTFSRQGVTLIVDVTL